MRRRFIGLTAFGVAALVALWLASGAAALSPASAEPPGGRAPLTADGASVFAAECARCHGNAGEGATEGPSLHALPAGEATIPGVAELVRSGWGEMPSFGDTLTTPEITAVAEYVVAEFGTPGEVARGGELYRLNCAGCHGAAGRGGALIYSTPNAPSLSSVTDAEVVAAVRGGPGTMPAFNEAALPDLSVASISDYVAVLRDPAQPGGLAIAPAGPVTEGFLAGIIGLGAALIAAAWVTRGGHG